MNDNALSKAAEGSDGVLMVMVFQNCDAEGYGQ